MDESAIERKLGSIASILKLAHKQQLDEIAGTVRSEPGKAAILDETREWAPGGPLVKSVAEEAKKSKRTIQTYIGELLDLGVLEKRGAGRSIEYRSTGII